MNTSPYYSSAFLSHCRILVSPPELKKQRSANGTATECKFEVLLHTDAGVHYYWVSLSKTQNQQCCFLCSITQDTLPMPSQASILQVTHPTVKCPIPDGVWLHLAHAATGHPQLGSTNSYSASKLICSNGCHWQRDFEPRSAKAANQSVGLEHFCTALNLIEEIRGRILQLCMQ